MPVPVDPGISLQDNVQEPILLEGATGLHERFLRLYNALNGALDETNLDPNIFGLIEQAYYSGSQKPGSMQNVAFSFGGTGNGTLTIHQANGNAFADTDGNRGYVWMRSATSGRIIRGKVTANVQLGPVGCHFGAGTKGDLTDAILRLYAINDGNTSDDFTPKWGLGYQGGFNYIRNTQGSDIGTDINLPEEIFVNSVVVNDNSPMSDVGYILANFDDTGNPNGEDFWTITAARPGESADGIWQPFNTTHVGFAGSGPTSTRTWTMVGNTCFVTFLAGSNNLSNSTNWSMQLPIKYFGPNAIASSKFLIYAVTDNGVALDPPGYGSFVDNSTTINLEKSFSSTAWTNGGLNSANFKISYEAHQP